MDAWTGLPWLWAQTTASSSGAGAGPGADPSLLVALLALRRWCSGLTLAPPDPSSGLVSPGLWAWLAGLGVLLAMAAALQGPGRAVGQVLDLAGHGRLLSAALGRLRRSGRLVAVVVGMTVVTWTASQTASYSRAQGRDEALLVTRGHSLAGVALGHGVLAALTPLRDVGALGLMIPMLGIASVVLFRFVNDRWGDAIRPPRELRDRVSRWATIGWTGLAVYMLYYRFVGLLAGQGGLPSGGCLVVEVALVPALMALSLGVVLAWVLAELRGVGLDGSGGESLDVLGTIVLIPAAMVAGLLAFPSAFVATAALLVGPYAPPGTPAGAAFAPVARWVLGWGLADIQAFGLAWVGMLGAVAWSRGTPGDALRGYARLLSAEGGRLVASVAAAGVAAGAGASVAYFAVLALPASTWVLRAADSYAHYATVPVGLVLLAAVVELGERSLPAAGLAEPDAGPPDARAAHPKDG